MFKQNDGLWYFKYKDDRGRWRTYATHTRSEEEAREIEEVFKGNERITVPETVTGLLEMFTVPERNPDYLDARITGRNYGERHAKEVARNMKDLSELVSVRGGIGRIQLQKLTRVQCKMAMTKIHEKWGNTDKARKMFSEFKACLTYAADQGWIDSSPAQGMDEIRVEKKHEVIPMTPNDIREILTRPELFRFSRPFTNKREEEMMKGRDKEDYVMFCLLAYTGMRRAEAAALTSGQIRDGIYRGRAFHYIEIDRAFKDESWKVVGKPKWDLCRSIPINEWLYDKIKPLIKEDAKERLFPTYTQSRFRQMFDRLTENADIDSVEWEDKEAFLMLSPHKLRHALNTNLLADQMESEGQVTETMVAEYLSWEHQDQSKMQRRYTHLVASRLLPVSDMIGEIYSVDSFEKKMLSIV